MSKGRIRKQASLVVIGDGLNFASGIVSAMILARVMPVEVMGTYRQVFYLLPMGVTFVEMGLVSTVYRFWNALDYSAQVSYTKMVVAASLLLGLSASVVLAILAPSLARWYHNPDLKLALLIAAPYPLATLPLMLLRPVLLSKGYSIRATSLETGFALFSTVPLVVPLWLGVSLPTTLAIWMAISLLLLGVIPIILKEYLWAMGSWWDKKIFQEAWNYMWPIAISRVPGEVNSYLDKVVMSVFLSVQDFAVYSLGAREIPFIGRISNSVGQVMVPTLVKEVTKGQFEEVKRIWRQACEHTAVVTYLIAAFCIWYAEPVMQFLFSPTYSGSSVPFRFFAAVTFLRVVDFGSLAKAMGRTEIILRSACMMGGSMVLLSLILVPPLGIVGMGLAVFLGILATVIYYLIQYRKMLGTTIGSFFPWPRLLLLFIIAGCSVAGSGLVMGRFIDLATNISILALGWKLGVLCIVSGVIYLACLLSFGFLNLASVFTGFTREKSS